MALIFLRLSLLMVILFCNETIFGMMLSTNPMNEPKNKNYLLSKTRTERFDYILKEEEAQEKKRIQYEIELKALRNMWQGVWNT